MPSPFQLIRRAVMLTVFCAHEAGAAVGADADYASDRAEMVARQIAERGAQAQWERQLR